VSGQTNREQIKRDLIHTVNDRYNRQGDRMLVSTVVVHPGPRAWKTVSLLTFLNEDTGEIRRRELRSQTWKAIPPSQGGGYDFSEDDYHWHCEDDEIEALRFFLNGEFAEPGKYRLIERGTEFDKLLEQVERDDIVPAELVKLIQQAGHAPEIVSTLATSTEGQLLAEAVELQRRRDQLAILRRIVQDPASSERDDIHPQLKRMAWIFGGRYVGESRRKQLTTGDVLDVPLIRPDGSLHVVELKGANIPSLVRRHRGPTVPQETGQGREELPLVVGNDVHEAVGQVMNYLCHLDEDRDHILTKFKIETRRASATVLVGHPNFVQGEFTDEEIASTLRIYNGHLSRIEVMHYRDLIENAERDLALAAAPTADDGDQADLVGDQKKNETVSAGDDPWAQPDYDDPWSQVAQTAWSDEPPF
jgi:hypothetical protein